jgi:hypothetical protein
MPDIQELLAGAARPPGTDVDPSAVIRRGRVLRRHRQAGVGAAALVALAVPVGVLTVGGGTGGEDELVPVPGVTSTPPAPVPEPSRGGAAPPDVSPTAGVVTGAASATASANAAPGVAPTSIPTAPGTVGPTASPGGGGGAGDYPPMSGCSVETMTLAPGQSATCRYTATAAGGWLVTYDGLGVFAGGNYETPVRIVITRDGQRFVSTEECGSQQIRRGDRVSITIRQYDNGISDHTLHAGPGYGC